MSINHSLSLCHVYVLQKSAFYLYEEVSILHRSEASVKIMSSQINRIRLLSLNSELHSDTEEEKKQQKAMANLTSTSNQK